MQNLENYIDEDNIENDGDEFFKRENCESPGDWIGRIIGGIAGGLVLFSPMIWMIHQEGLSGIFPGIMGQAILLMILGIPMFILSMIAGGIVWIAAWMITDGIFLVWKRIHRKSYESTFGEEVEVALDRKQPRADEKGSTDRTRGVKVNRSAEKESVDRTKRAKIDHSAEKEKETFQGKESTELGADVDDLVKRL
ncbi:hypothetical protein [Halostagnicola sp. A-GB9-2]|uniref:hypothetical protein n=1 Tax=Halostagnicola sp. A-GB9-2 TaxID=3048066 RepID=UPI0024C04F76|nr:hypothetical protein [Halostagnicola sp. A-GB9-2]MDJ1432463.1 hypothetical protein [Halostagnicola sp. A-GB9-2]